MLLLLFLVALNGAISWWNCYVTGSIWAESKVLGGWIRVLAWCGAIQAAIGFSSVILVALALITGGTGYLPPEGVKALVSLWYLLIIIPALTTGYVITIHSWIEAYRERSLLNMTAAAWNTFASVYNTYGAISGMGDAMGAVFEVFSKAFNASDNTYWRVAVIITLLAAISLLGGALITAMLIKKYAARLPLPQRATA